MSNYILPKKWAIRQNHKEINDWLNINKQTNSNYDYDSIGGSHFVHYPEYNKYHLHSEIRPGYTEISFKEFEIGVLKTKQYTQDTELNQILIKLLTE